MDAIAKTTRKEMTWKLLGHEQPSETEKEYLINIEWEGKDCICIGLWDEQIKRFMHPIDFRVFSFVTHWMDLPDTPSKN